MTDQPEPRGPIGWARKQQQDRAAALAPDGGSAVPAAWSQLEAHAFNAVQPALRAAGAWLPLSARRAVARAVLETILGPIPTGTDTATWTAVRAIQLMHEAGRQRDAAEAALARVETLAAQIAAGHPVQDNPDNLAAAIRDAASTGQTKES
ncbi:hypothetical protein [Streptomyces viridosporus]|nr:hypothetical protein [Streptomyces viridosporus]